MHCALFIPRPQRARDVANFKIALQVPTMRQRHSCISHGSNVYHNALRSWHATMYKFVTSMMLCRIGKQQSTMQNATIQKTTFFELGVYKQMILAKATQPTATTRFETSFSSESCKLDWKKIYVLLFKATQSTKLPEFQCKVLNIFVYTNLLLHKIGKVNSPLC